MADISVEQKPRNQKTWILAALAVVAIIGLMAWLYNVTSDLQPVAVVEDEAVQTGTTGAAGAPTGEDVELAALAASPDGHMERDLFIDDVEVAAVLGARAFWADVPGQNPFLVVLGQNVVDVQIPVPGMVMDLQGRVLELTEGNITAWVNDETIRSNAADEASFATHYLLVSAVEVQEL